MSFAASTPLPTLIFVAASALVATGCGLRIDFDDDTITRTETDIIDAVGVTELDLRTANGRVTVRSAPAGGETVELTTIFKEEDTGDATSSVDTDGDRLVVQGECDAGFLDSCSIGYEVVVPADFDVTVHSENGRIDVNDIDGGVTATTDNGLIAADSIDGDVDLESDNGRITATDLAGARVRARSDNGRIEISFGSAPGTVDVSTDNGAISVTVPDDDSTYRVDASSDNGSVDNGLRTDPDSERSVTARSDNGDVNLRLAGDDTTTTDE